MSNRKDSARTRTRVEVASSRWMRPGDVDVELPVRYVATGLVGVKARFERACCWPEDPPTRSVARLGSSARSMNRWMPPTAVVRSISQLAGAVTRT